MATNVGYAPSQEASGRVPLLRSCWNSALGEEMVLFVARRQLEEWDADTQRRVLRLTRATYAELLPLISNVETRFQPPCRFPGMVGLRDLNLWLEDGRGQDGSLEEQVAHWTHLTRLQSIRLEARHGWCKLRIPASLAAVSSVQDVSMSQLALHRLENLSLVTALTSLSMDGCHLDLRTLPVLPSLQALSMYDCRIGAADMRRLARLTALRELHISGYVSGWIHRDQLSALTGLQRLGLWHWWHDSSCGPMAALTALTHLTLQDRGVTSIQALAALTQLRELSLGGAAITDLTPLNMMRSLQNVDLSIINVVDVSPLAGLHSLRRLNLDRTPTADLGPIASLSSLRQLELRLTSVQDLSPLSGLRSLQHLDLADTPVNDLQPLGQLINLVYLDLSSTPINDLQPLAQLINLKCLIIWGQEDDQPLTVAPLVGLTNLTQLHVGRRNVEDLQLLPYLEQLRVNRR